MLEYNNFISERLFESLVNESFIYFTDKFKKVLKKVNNDISDDILSVEKDDVKPDMTFIDLSDKDGYISFSQIKKTINSIKKWGEEEDRNSEPIIHNIESGDFEFGERGTIDNVILSKSRNEVRIGKLINSLFPDKYDAKQIEDFVQKFKAFSEDVKDFELVNGEDIRHWYNMGNYKDQEGTLGTSCMRYPNCEDYLNIYTENPEVCRLLILKDNEDNTKIIGRALIWKLDSISKVNPDTEPIYFMDRIYVSDVKYMEDFKDYSNKNGWVNRTGTSYSDTKSVTYKKHNYEYVNMSVSLNKYIFDEYPYMDTFKKINIDEGFLYNNDERENDCYLLEETDGTYDDCSGKYSEYYDQNIPEDEAVYSDALNDYLFRDSSIRIRIGRYRGYYPDDYEDICYDEYREEHIHVDDSIYCEYDNQCFFVDDEITCITEFNGVNDYNSQPFSENSTDIVECSKMACESYLEDNDLSNYYFNKDILSKNEDGDYYLDNFKVKVINTTNKIANPKGGYTDIDCYILDIKDIQKYNDNKYYYTDEFDYNYVLDRDLVLSKCKEKINKIESILNNKQLMIDLDDNEEYINKNKDLLDKLSVRYDELESF